MKLTEAEKELIGLNIGVDGQDDTIYETVERIYTARITSLVAKLPKEYTDDGTIDDIGAGYRNKVIAEVKAILEAEK
jgi:hypothetical protein